MRFDFLLMRFDYFLQFSYRLVIELIIFRLTASQTPRKNQLPPLALGIIVLYIDSIGISRRGDEMTLL